MKLLLAIPLLFLTISCGAQKESPNKNSNDELVWHTDMNKAIAISQKKTNPCCYFSRVAIGVAGASSFKKKFF